MNKIKQIASEFREFAMRGNVIDLAVGVIIGGAFNKIITSLVTNVIMPPIGLILGKVDFSNLYLNLSSRQYSSLAEATKAGAPLIKYGEFLNSVIDFLIVAFVIFIFIKQMNKLHKGRSKPPSTRACPYCLEEVALKATRCPHCTSELKQAKS